MRVLSALVLLAVALACVFAGGIPFLILVGAACAVLVIEWVSLCHGGKSASDSLNVAAVCMFVVVALAAVAGGTGSPAIGVALLSVGALLLALSGERAIAGPVVNPGRIRYTLALGFPYIGLAAVALPWLRADPAAGVANTLFILCVVWGSDIGAYTVGRLLGGAKLAPAISPGKTWSGAIGGLGGAALAGIAVAACFSQVFSPAYVIGLAAGLGVVSQAGDLLESGLKRYFGVKDSGRIIPGHGGLLDRLDSLLAVAPVAALLAYSVGRGEVLWR